MQSAPVVGGQLTCVHWHGVLTPSQPGLTGVPPTKWSPSSVVITNSVLSFVIPSPWSRAKNVGEGLVVVVQLLHVAGLTGAVRLVDLAGDAVVVVGVREVAEGDRHAVLLHGHVTRASRPEDAVEAREADVAGRVLDDGAVQAPAAGPVLICGGTYLLPKSPLKPE